MAIRRRRVIPPIDPDMSVGWAVVQLLYAMGRSWSPRTKVRLLLGAAAGGGGVDVLRHAHALSILLLGLLR